MQVFSACNSLAYIFVFSRSAYQKFKQKTALRELVAFGSPTTYSNPTVVIAFFAVNKIKGKI